MPARVIRGEINSSRSLSRVSLEADLTFRALIVAVDDYGRADGRIQILRSLLYPTRPQVTCELLEGWLSELERAGCVLRYEFNGEPFLCLTGWERYRGRGRRAARSRFPGPKWNDTEILGSPVGSEDADSGIRNNANGSADEHGDPPEKRETRSEKREARDENREAGGESALSRADTPADGEEAPGEPSEVMLAALSEIFPKLPRSMLRLKARGCLAYYRARGEKRTDWTAQVESWLAKDLAEEGPQRPATMSPRVVSAT